ncbi:SLC13 family permease [Marinobacterium lutimaris]|uniref:Di-and tricarboxylate transporter n=1 Tax=Marinobacterium lutimaris TaxID=568106 RepID=A0A1H5Z6N5_9GAMM|nr:SLC13 family permease [Marinobacterium lutimaris]SEG31305.1 Di-and tricarboxylate transporter [Marinobacterium lutimaris]
MSWIRRPANLIMLLLLPLALWVAIAPMAPLTPLQGRSLAIVILTLGLLVTNALPGYMTALLFFLAALLSGIAPPDEVFSGFSSGALWLIFSGMVMGLAIKSTGLGARIAGLLGHHLDGSYARLIFGLMAACTLLGFLMPSSMGRAVMMIPIGLAIADRCGFMAGSRGRTGVVLAVAFGCHMPTFAIMPANIPNMVMIGSAETVLDMTFSYTHYLLLHFPVLGVLKAAVGSLLIVWLFREQPDTEAALGPAETDGAAGQGQVRLLVVLALALGFWMTDSLHGISPAWVGLAAACLLLLPGFGLVGGKQLSEGIDITLLLFIAGILGLGQLVASTGLGDLLAVWLEQLLPLQQGADFINFMSLSLMSFVVSLVATLPGVPAVLTPVAPDLAVQTGWSVEAVVMTQVLGFSTVLFPYQSGPLLVSMQLAKEPLGQLLKITVPLTLITLFVLLPLDYLWWLLIGEIG